MGSLEPVAERLEQACADATTPGAACVVVHKGVVVHRSAHGITGFHPAGSARAVTPETWFDVASLTKVMATTAIAIALHSERRLHLDTPVSRLLLEFVRESHGALRGRDESSPKSEVTVGDLLAHRSGLPAWRPFWERAAADMVASRVFTDPAARPTGVERTSAFRRARHLARETAAAEPLEARPRTRAVYSDPGFIVLGMLLERAGGAGLDVLFEKIVARPFGLESTFFVDETRPSPRRPSPCAATRLAGSRGGATSIGEVDDDNAFALAGVAGHAGLFSTADDVAAFGEGMRRLAGGSWIGSLRPRSVRAFLQRDATTPGSHRAFGFDMPSGEMSAAGSSMSREATFGHLGFTGCSLWFDLSAELTVALLTNRVHCCDEPSRIQRLRSELHDLVFASL